MSIWKNLVTLDTVLINMIDKKHRALTLEIDRYVCVECEEEFDFNDL